MGFIKFRLFDAINICNKELGYSFSFGYSLIVLTYTKLTNSYVRALNRSTI